MEKEKRFFAGLWFSLLKEKVSLGREYWKKMLNSPYNIQEIAEEYYLQRNLKKIEKHCFQKRKLLEKEERWKCLEPFLFSMILLEQAEKQLTSLKYPLSFYDHVFYGEKDFPEKLLSIPQAPLSLFALSKRKSFQNLAQLEMIAVVGSRKASPYGLRLCEDIVKRFVALGYPILSGLALGIDTQAHVSCLENGMGSIAILAHGFQFVYPKENENLFQNMIENGIILSEYAPFEKALPYRFRERNRLMSGLAKAVFIPEASLKSGTLLTATFASEQGRDVYVCPGSFYSSNSGGTHLLISEGAYIFFEHEQIERNFPLQSSVFGFTKLKNKGYCHQEILKNSCVYFLLSSVQEREKTFAEIEREMDEENRKEFKMYLGICLKQKWILQKQNYFFLSEKGETFLKEQIRFLEKRKIG